MLQLENLLVLFKLTASVVPVYLYESWEKQTLKLDLISPNFGLFISAFQMWTDLMQRKIIIIFNKFFIYLF